MHRWATKEEWFWQPTATYWSRWLIIAHWSIIIAIKWWIGSIRACWITFNMPWRLLIVVFLVAVCKKTAKRNILGAVQAKDNKDDKIIALTPPALKNNNQMIMVTECGSVRMRWAMEGWKREVRGQGKDGAGVGGVQSLWMRRHLCHCRNDNFHSCHDGVVAIVDTQVSPPLSS
jgi:hypothetical protein